MKHLRIGDKVKLGGVHTGEITGVGHTMMLVNPDLLHPTATAMPGEVFIVRLDSPFLLTNDDIVVRNKAPSSMPGAMFVFEIAVCRDSLEVL